MLTEGGAAVGVCRGGHNLIGTIRGSGGAWRGGSRVRIIGPETPPQQHLGPLPPSRPLPPLTCRAGGGAAHGAAGQRARARGGGVSAEGGGVSAEGGGVSAQRGGASPRGAAPSAGLVDHGVGDIHGGGRGGLGRHRDAPEGGAGGLKERRDTWPGLPVPPDGQYSPEQRGPQGAPGHGVLVQGGLGRQGVTCGPPNRGGLPELPRPPLNLSPPQKGQPGSFLSLPLSGGRKCRGRPGPHPAPDAPRAPGWAPPPSPGGSPTLTWTPRARLRWPGGGGGAMGVLREGRGVSGVCGARRGPGGFSGPPRRRPRREPCPWAGPELPWKFPLAF